MNGQNRRYALCFALLTAGLLVLAALLGTLAATALEIFSEGGALALLTISDNPFTGEGLDAEQRQNTFTQMMEIALEIA